jgi:Transglutaminase-like superfamily
MNPSPPSSSAPLGPLQRLVLTAELVVSYGVARRLVRRTALPATLEQLREGRCVPAPWPLVTDNPYQLAAVTGRVLRLVPADTRCLMRSLTLLTLLARRGVSVTLVLAATEEEQFGAHAWVELHGRPLLTPEAEHRRLVEL